MRVKQRVWMVFYDDTGDREGCNVYYAWLTHASSEQEAIDKVRAAQDLSDEAELVAEEREIIP